VLTDAGLRQSLSENPSGPSQISVRFRFFTDIFRNVSILRLPFLPADSRVKKPPQRHQKFYLYCRPIAEAGHWLIHFVITITIPDLQFTKYEKNSQKVRICLVLFIL
jgi:hypothetical protein